MIEILPNVVQYVAVLAEKVPALMTVLVVIGGAYLTLMVLQPVVLALAKLTKTEKDDAFLAKFYDVLTDWGPCFAPAAALFKKKTGYETADKEPSATERKEE